MEVDRGTLSVAMSEPAGDFAHMFRLEFPRLAGFCAGLVGDPEVGADLAQEALARTWARWSAVEDPRAYAYLVATNLVRRQWKRRARDRQIRSVLLWRSSGQSSPDGTLRDLVDRLPPRLRSATLLHYYADLPVEQVARLLHRPEGSIRQRLHQARQILARELGKED